MSESITDTLIALLNVAPFSRVRRNHGLEHATLHVLAQRNPLRGMGGISDWRGFWIMGDIPSDELAAAVREALQRLHKGEARLAVHPNCGTNFATAGILAGAAAFLAMLGSGKRMRDKLERLPLVMTLATITLVFAQPFGLLLQEHVTTSGDPGALEVVKIIPTRRGQILIHRVITEG
jgi:hypothetical protein